MTQTNLKKYAFLITVILRLVKYNIMVQVPTIIIDRNHIEWSWK